MRQPRVPGRAGRRIKRRREALAQRLYPRLRRNELLVADRGFYPYHAWDTAAATGAALVWRAPTQLSLPVLKVLHDGTYLLLRWMSVVMDSTIRGKRRGRIVTDARTGHTLIDHSDATNANGWPPAQPQPPRSMINSSNAALAPDRSPTTDAWAP